jgi:hypothetical protein
MQLNWAVLPTICYFDGDCPEWMQEDSFANVVKCDSFDDPLVNEMPVLKNEDPAA